MQGSALTSYHVDMSEDIIINYNKGNRCFPWYFLFIYSHFFLHSTRVERPQICCLLYFVILV